MSITLKNNFTPGELANEITRNLRVYKETNADKNVLVDIENIGELAEWLIWHLRRLKRTAEENQEFASVKEIYLKSDDALKKIRIELGDEKG